MDFICKYLTESNDATNHSTVSDFAFVVDWRVTLYQNNFTFFYYACCSCAAECIYTIFLLNMCICCTRGTFCKYTAYTGSSANIFLVFPLRLYRQLQAWHAYYNLQLNSVFGLSIIRALLIISMYEKLFAACFITCMLRG